MKDFSKYPGLLKMCGYCSKKAKQTGLQPDQYICTEKGHVVFSHCDDAMTCDKFDGANLEISSLHYK